MRIPFVKMHGAGNDYVFVDGFQHEVPDPASLSRLVSDRRRGIGSDGLILILPSATADARMAMFNADGSEGITCGNGLRCLARFLFDRRRAERRMTIETRAGLVPAEVLEVDGEGRALRLRLDMGEPRLERADIPMTGPPGRVLDETLEAGGRAFTVTALGMGNPHCVVFVPDVEAADVAGDGRRIQECGRFPEGVNVEFVERRGAGHLLQRTFERGSGETLACGSGAVAAAVAARLGGDPGPEVRVTLRGGELQVTWAGEGHHAWLAGPAEESFEGVLRLSPPSPPEHG